MNSRIARGGYAGISPRKRKKRERGGTEELKKSRSRCPREGFQTQKFILKGMGTSS